MQQLHGRLLRFLCKLSKRLVEKLASLKPGTPCGAPWPPRPLTPAGLSTDRRTGGTAGRSAWKGRGSGESSPREDAKSKGQRCSPQVGGRLPPSAAPFGESQRFRAPPPPRPRTTLRKSHRTSATPDPKHPLSWEAADEGGVLALYFPCSLNFLQPTSQPVLLGREKLRLPRRSSTPAGRQLRLTSPHSAPRPRLGRGSEAPHGFAAAPGVRAAHGPRGAPMPTEKSERGSPVRSALGLQLQLWQLPRL